MTAHATSNLPVIWITGASSGIGKAFAQQYAKDGAHLILSSRQVDELEKLKFYDTFYLLLFDVNLTLFIYRLIYVFSYSFY